MQIKLKFNIKIIIILKKSYIDYIINIRYYISNDTISQTDMATKQSLSTVTPKPKRASSREVVDDVVMDYARKNVDASKLPFINIWINNQKQILSYKVVGTSNVNCIESLARVKSVNSDDYIWIILPISATSYMYYRGFKYVDNTKFNKVDYNNCLDSLASTYV